VTAHGHTTHTEDCTKTGTALRFVRSAKSSGKIRRGKNELGLEKMEEEKNYERSEESASGKYRKK
jgi:hypothetical protein